MTEAPMNGISTTHKQFSASEVNNVDEHRNYESFYRGATNYDPWIHNV